MPMVADTSRRLLQVVALVVLAAQPVSATPALDGSVVYEGWYVVRVGDTLEGITQRYLGDAQRWQENWRLNPELADPHNLKPGQRLRILLRSVPDEGALLTKMSNRVEGRLPPLDWQAARVRDVLRPRDSVRTFEQSSAELSFGDETRLTVSEQSLIFLDRGSVPGPAPVTRDQIEIVLGQADLGGRGLGSAGEAIELVIGDAVAVPAPSSAGQVQARARKASAGAQLMAYQGASRLTAAGVEIEVPQGSGSAVAEGAPPGPPETLLPAPTALAPPAAARLMTPRPELSWSPEADAVGYVVEVCRDAECAELVLRAVTDAAQVWRPPTPLPVADLHWRVTAVSRSGLDGYPSTSRAVTIASDAEDTTPPEPEARPSGPFVPPRSGLNERWILGPGAGLDALAQDAESGVERIETRLDGEPVSLAEWRGPWPPGRHEASLLAVDGAGNRADVVSFPFVYDTAPPALSWGIEGVGRLATLEAKAGSGEDRAGPYGHRSRRVFEVDDPHSIWPWRRQAWTVRHDGRQVTVTPSRPVLVRIRQEVGDDDAGTDELAFVLTPGRGLWVLAQDEVCGPSLRLDHELEIAVRRRGLRKQGVLTLRLVAEDCVTNRSEATLHLTTAKADRAARAKLRGGADPKT